MRHQKGQLLLSNGAFYVRYYKDGKRVAHRLCSKDDKHYAIDSKAVKLLAPQQEGAGHAQTAEGFGQRNGRQVGPSPCRAISAWRPA